MGSFWSSYPTSVHLDPSRNSVRTANLRDVCNRCSVLTRPLEDQTKEEAILGNGLMLGMFTIEEMPEQLINSRCGFCSFFGMLLIEHQKMKKARPLQCCVDIYLGSRTCGTGWLSLAYADSTSSNEYLTTITYQDATNKQAFSTPSSVVDYGKLRTWVRDCEEHDLCKVVPNEPVQGLKFIDCGADPPTIISAPVACPYVALSYVWGDSTEDRSFKEGDKLDEELPQTIEDSIKVTLELGFQYLWIDRYCIDQQETEDKSYQIGQMGAVYANAKVTLVAAAGHNPSHGLPGVSDDRPPPFYEISIGSITLRHVWNSLRDIESSTWAFRGWTLQESYLSRKLLFFTGRMVVFVCNSTIMYEHTSEELASYRMDGTLVPSFGRYRAQLYGASDLLKTYSKRHLRDDDDALNAVSGVLNVLTKPGSMFAHLEGIHFERPSSSSTLYLSWESYKPGSRRQRFPSWSPLGWTSQIEFKARGVRAHGGGVIRVWVDDEWVIWSSLIPAQIERLRIDPPPSSRFLQISALTFRLSLSWKILRGLSHITESQLCCSGIDRFLFEPYWDSALPDLALTDDILCWVPEHDPSLLILLKSSNVRPSIISTPDLGELPVYERVGTIDQQDVGRMYLMDEDEGMKVFSNDVCGDDHDRLQSILRSECSYHYKGTARSCPSLKGRVETFILA